MTSRYELIVGNIGTVIETDNGFSAYQEYQRYVGLSRGGYGRAAGENVTLLCDGEVQMEYFGTNQQNDEDDGFDDAGEAPCTVLQDALQHDLGKD